MPSWFYLFNGRLDKKAIAVSPCNNPIGLTADSPDKMLRRAQSSGSQSMSGKIPGVSG